MDPQWHAMLQHYGGKLSLKNIKTVPKFSFAKNCGSKILSAQTRSVSAWRSFLPYLSALSSMRLFVNRKFPVPWAGKTQHISGATSFSPAKKRNLSDDIHHCHPLIHFLSRQCIWCGDSQILPLFGRFLLLVSLLLSWLHRRKCWNITAHLHSQTTNLPLSLQHPECSEHPHCKNATLLLGPL